MNMEQMGLGSNEKIALGNQMQVMLAEKHGEDIGVFIDQHAAKFREYIDGNATILETFKTNPDEALREIEPILYH